MSFNKAIAEKMLEDWRENESRGWDASVWLAAAQVYATLALVEAQKGPQIDIVPDVVTQAPKTILSVDGWYKEIDDTVSGRWLVKGDKAHYTYPEYEISDDSDDWWPLEKALEKFGPFVPWTG